MFLLITALADVRIFVCTYFKINMKNTYIINIHTSVCSIMLVPYRPRAGATRAKYRLIELVSLNSIALSDEREQKQQKNQEKVAHPLILIKINGLDNISDSVHTQRHEGGCLFPLPLTLERCSSHAQQPEGLLKNNTVSQPMLQLWIKTKGKAELLHPV